ncbi:OsmC family protein [Acidobacteria bacterium AB60]|nr:OsmC family protein [Acidobacteria bacterium AB60]
MEVNVTHHGAVKFEVRAGRHTLICDQPPANGGSDEGMTPPELFLSGLASCAAFYAVAYLKKKGLQREGITVRATCEKAGPPARLDHFHIEVDVPGPLSQADHAGVLDSVHRCLIHNTLQHPPQIHIELHAPVAA